MASLDTDGVYLLPSTAPEFREALHPERDTRFDILLPYAVLIKNDSDKEVIAYSIRCICRDANGKTGIPEVTPFDSSSLRYLPGHASQIVSNVDRLGSPHLKWDRAQEDAESLLAFFLKQQTVDIALEAVLFEDGTAAGADRNGWIPRWKANIDAERDVFSTVSQRTPNVRDILAALAESAFSRFEQRYRDRDHLLLAANKSQTYEECYVLMQGFIASTLLDDINSDGENATILRVTNYIRSKKYPNVHKRASDHGHSVPGSGYC